MWRSKQVYWLVSPLLFLRMSGLTCLEHPPATSASNTYSELATSNYRTLGGEAPEGKHICAASGAATEDRLGLIKPTRSWTVCASTTASG